MFNIPSPSVGTKLDLRSDQGVVKQLQAKGQKVISTQEVFPVSRGLGTVCHLTHLRPE